MTIAEINIACALNHIETLRRHGAQVTGPDGQRVELNSFFWGRAMDACMLGDCSAICYDLFLPGIEEPLLIAIHRDGRVDSGRAENGMRGRDR